MVRRFVTLLVMNFARCVCGLMAATTWAQPPKTETSNTPAVEVAAFEGETKVVPLPANLRQLVVGGAGRYLLVHLPEIKKIGVFDISQAKMTGYVAADSDDSLMAATKDKLLVVSPSQHKLTRWNLNTRQKELVVSIPFAGPVQSIAAGCSANGPVMVTWSATKDPLADVSFAFLDVDTLREIKVTWTGQNSTPRYRDEVILRASSNGEYFTISRMGAVHIEGTQVSASLDPFGRGHMIPSANGQYYAQNGELVNFEGTSLSGDPNAWTDKLGGIVPSVTGNFFLTFPFEGFNDSSAKEDARLYMFGDKRPLLSIPGLKIELPADNRSSREIVFPTERVTFVPEAKVVVIPSSTNDALVLTRFDVDQALDASGIDYLIVTSTPATTVKLGEKFEYPLQVKSKLGGLKYKLESGPAGMEITADGKVIWDVPKKWTERANQVIITVGDSGGQELFHTFTLDVPQVRDATVKPNAKKSAADSMDANDSRRNTRNAGRSPTEPSREERRIAAEIRSEELSQRRKQAIAENIERQRAAKEAAAKKPAEPPAITFESRTWTDITGNHKIEASFARIVDKKTVMLKSADGSEKSIPLSRLSPEDMYHAIECDVKRLQKTK